MAKDRAVKPERYLCAGITFCGSIKIKLMHKPYTRKYKVVVEGVRTEEYSFSNWPDAEAKYLSITKQLNHQIT